jgi:(E)-4-hydroxy-3-methylbut-2-enyl-diphosphate synthase
MTETEYIACPSCGRTLFDIQDTLAKVRTATSHLKHLKIAVMGCIVNGPGEMADADYGYVGSAKGKVSLYRKKEIVKKQVAEQDAIRELVNLIKENGDWND